VWFYFGYVILSNDEGGDALKDKSGGIFQEAVADSYKITKQYSKKVR
jgi:hypothetical protein